MGRTSLCLLSAACAAVLSIGARAAEGSGAGDAALRALMDEMWAWTLREYPEFATQVGAPGGDDRWTDLAPAAIARRRERAREFLGRLRAIPAGGLTGRARHDLRLLLWGQERAVAAERFPGHVLALDQMGGVQISPARLLIDMPRGSGAALENLLARLERLPALIGQTTDLLREGLRLGVTPPRICLRGVPAQVRRIAPSEVEESPFWEPFRDPPAGLGEETWHRARDRARALLRERVFPAYAGFGRFLEGEYLPGCRESVGWGALPDGAAWYAEQARDSTTTDLGPEEIHRIGISEVARIGEEMGRVARSAGYADAAAYGRHLRGDAAQRCRDAAELVEAYRALCKRIDAGLPALFGRLPRLPYGVRELTGHAGPDAPAAYYEGGSLEAGRPGWFTVNVDRLETRYRWEMAPLALHEAVPGHHLQIALAQEEEGRHPLLRHSGGPTAYVEGWALYAERLGEELGMYGDPASRFGRLNFEMWRSVRLVVDTGLHAMGWERERAIRFFREHAAKADREIEVEIDRYLVMPAQALAYKIGERKLVELRARAEQRLGEGFRPRAFHDVVLGRGAMPLGMLEERVEEWIRGGSPSR